MNTYTGSQLNALFPFRLDLKLCRAERKRFAEELQNLFGLINQVDFHTTLGGADFVLPHPEARYFFAYSAGADLESSDPALCYMFFRDKSEAALCKLNFA